MYLCLSTAVSRPRERLFGESSMSVTSQISGDNKETMAAEVIELDTDEESWSCVRCTFLNHPLINTCECCLLERSSASGEQLVIFSVAMFMSAKQCRVVCEY